MIGERGGDDEARDRTIRDFGRQWTTYTENEGYYGSVELLKDIIEPLLPIERLRGMSVADIGSGTGRIVLMMMEAGAARIHAVERARRGHRPVVSRRLQQRAGIPPTRLQLDRTWHAASNHGLAECERCGSVDPRALAANLAQ